MLKKILGHKWKALAVAALVLAMVSHATGASKVYVDILNDKLVSLANTITTSKPVVDLVQTWNSGGVTFELIKVDVTATAAATASKIFDIEVDNSDIFTLRKDGLLTLGGSGAGITGGTVTGTTVSGTTSVTIGTGGTALTKAVVYSTTLTPTQLAANACSASSTMCQTTVALVGLVGLSTSDKLTITPPMATNYLAMRCPVIGADVSATNTIRLWVNKLTGTACTPQSGTHKITAVRS